MKIKLRDLIECYRGVTGVYDSITKFSRVVDLSDNMEEVKRAVELFDERKDKQRPKGDMDGNVTPYEVKEYNEVIEQMLDEEVELKRPPKFTAEECEAALKNKKALNPMSYLKLRHYFLVKEGEK